MDKLRWLMTAAAAFVVTVLHDGSNHNAAILAAVTAYTKRNLSVVVESGGRMRWAVWLCGMVHQPQEGKSCRSYWLDKD